LGEEKISQTTNSLTVSQHQPPVTPKPLIPVNNTNEHKNFFTDNNTPINISRLLYWLHGYNRKKFNNIMESFKFGFDVGYKGTLSPKMIDNLASAKAKPDIVNEKIKKELEAKRFVGPFDLKPFRVMQLSPLGLVEKKTPGTYRMIHHLSFPEGSSINDGIPEEDSHVQYTTIQDAIEIIKAVGPHSYCAKTDISNAFRIIKVKESQYPLFGFMWEGKYYFDRNLQMGCSSSCKIL